MRRRAVAVPIIHEQRTANKSLPLRISMVYRRRKGRTCADTDTMCKGAIYRLGGCKPRKNETFVIFRNPTGAGMILTYHRSACGCPRRSEAASLVLHVVDVGRLVAGAVVHLLLKGSHVAKLVITQRARVLGRAGGGAGHILHQVRADRTFARVILRPHRAAQLV